MTPGQMVHKIKISKQEPGKFKLEFYRGPHLVGSAQWSHAKAHSVIKQSGYYKKRVDWRKIKEDVPLTIYIDEPRPWFWVPVDVKIVF